MKITLLTGGDASPHYVLGLLSGLISLGIKVDFIGSDAVKDAQGIKSQNVTFYNLRGDQNPNAPIKEKMCRVLKYYFKLVKYAAKTDSRVFHIQWLNKFTHFDRTFLNIYYEMLGKKVVFTAHNINAEERDGKSTFINRLSLKCMYGIVGHIIVHTKKMKAQLIEVFNIRENKVTVIPHGILNIVPNTELTTMEAKQKLALKGNDKVLLFFGRIAPYKGLEYLMLALVKLKEKYNDLRLIIAGRVNRKSGVYWENINRIIEERDLTDYIIRKIGFIPDEEIEVYYKCADVLILPYKNIFQTGVTFLSYSFGLPVIASDVGSLREDIVEGKTGFVCQPENPEDLAEKIELYFDSALYRNLEGNREKIIKYANEKYSWEKIGEKTCAVYRNLL